MKVKLAKFSELRAAAGYSRADLARIFGVNPSAVFRWETGNALPRAEKLPQLADLFNCTIDELFGRDGAETGPQ